MVSDGFEQVELDGPVWELRKAGATVEVLAHHPEQMTDGIRGLNSLSPARVIHVGKWLADASPEDYDGLLIPGGVFSIDRMRESRFHLAFARNTLDKGKPVGFLGHGGWILADAGIIQGRTVTSAPSIRKDLERAGAIWKDKFVIEDGSLVSSRNLQDVPAFSRTFVTQLERFSRTPSGAGHRIAG